MQGVQMVFHLAADHGGRGYVDLHQAGPASNLFVDGVLFWEALRQGVEKVVYASSGCVYPNYLQTDPTQPVRLTEDLVNAPYDADNMYGWAKLMGELTLKAYCREHGLKAASCRYFTVYGPRGVENHAVIAMIARAFVRQTPFEVWGDGTQVRNWTYIDDIVRGTLLAAEKIDDGTAVNLGTMERVRVIEAVRMVFEYTGHQAEIKVRLDMPTGPMNRVADNTLARRLLGWTPRVPFRDGLKRTIEWYFATKDREAITASLDRKLTER
jgi:nucleoside-diphosphate-sugar epimerase